MRIVVSSLAGESLTALIKGRVMCYTCFYVVVLGAVLSSRACIAGVKSISFSLRASEVCLCPSM